MVPTGDPSDSSPSDSDLSGSITVFACSSPRAAFTQIADDLKAAHPGTEVVFRFGSSGDLATFITQGAATDASASASPANMDTVVAACEAKDPENFISNLPGIAVTAGNPKKIATVAHLGKPGTKVALCAPTAPCGCAGPRRS